jgi:adenosylhomocysteine nucleosidase
MVSKQRLLLVAAEPREFSGLLPHCASVKKLFMPVHWARTAELPAYDLCLLANGAGPSRAGRAAEAALAMVQPAAVVSIGFCGAVDPALKIGDVFIATVISDSGGLLPAGIPALAPPHRCGMLASLDHVAQTASEKARLRAAGARAVEMEAAGVARAASYKRISFFCIRSVTDLAHETFANDFNSALRSDGHFGTMHLLRSAARHPRERVAELVRLARRCRIAAHTLGAFLADCRF